MRRKFSPFFLLLFEVLILFLLPCSESSTIPLTLSIRQQESGASDFNVVASDDGVPVLEPGENPAKDPLVIEDGSVPNDTPDQQILPDTTAPQPKPPKPQSPSKTNVSSPSEEQANDAEEEKDLFEDVTSETLEDDGLSDAEPSSEFEEEEDLSTAGATNKQPVSGNKKEDVLLHPEISALPDNPSPSKGSSLGRPSNLADPKPSASDEPTKGKPIHGDSSTGKQNHHEHGQKLEPSQELEPSPLSADDPDTDPPPEATSQSDIDTPAKPTRSDTPDLGGTEIKPNSQVSPANTASNPQGKENGVDPFSEEFVRPDATYRCVNFAARKFGEYEPFDESATDGSFTVYKGSGVALNPTLPMPYRYHVYGKNWTYHLNVASDTNQNVVLGFAEVFPKACASGRNGSFRVFTVSVGGDFQIVDVMKSSGCGTLQQAVFQDIKPKGQVIDLNLDAISGKAMLSVVCYGASAHATPKGTPTENPKAGISESGKNSGSSADKTTETYEQCFTFGEPAISGFTSIGIPELDSGLEIYLDESASVDNTDSPEVYRSHVFGSEFKLSIALGVRHSVTIQLGFAEIFEPGCILGFRVFTVKAGAELRTIDVFKEAGCGSAFTLELDNILPSTNGDIDIAFSSVSNSAMVSSVCIVDKNKAKGSQGFDKRPSLAISSTPKESEGSELTGAEINGGAGSDIETLLPSVEGFPEQSMEAGLEEDDDDIELELPQSSPYPKENGILIVPDPPNKSPDIGENPIESPLPKVNGLIDATLTSSPSPFGDTASDTGAESNISSETDNRAPEPSDELLPSDFSQTTVGEGANGKGQMPSPDVLVPPSNQSSGSSPALHGASGIENAPPAPSTTAEIQIPSENIADEPDEILPTKTPVPISGASVSDDGGANGVVDKQGEITIEGSSPSPSLLTVVIEAPTPSVSPVSAAIEGPSAPPSEEDAIIIGPESEATSTPTPSSISAAAFSPIPSTGEAAASPSIPGTATQSSAVTPQPVATAVIPNAESIEPTAALSPSPLESPTSTGDDVAPSPTESIPTGVTSPQVPTPGVTDGNVILPPVGTSPGPQGDPDGSSGGEGALTSPPPVATISQNQIIVLPSASPAQAPISASSSPLPQTSNSPDPIGIGPGIGAPDGDIAGSPAPDSSAANPSGSPVPDIVTNPSVTAASSPQATPSPPQTTSSVGSSEVIVDSTTTTEPSPSPVVSTSIGAPDDGPVQVTDNSTEIIQVTGDVGSNESETEKQPSILVGEYKDIIATTPAGSGFAIGMGILGSLLVLLLLVCLFFAIFRGGGAAYSYSSGYSSHKRTDYDPSQGQYTDDLGLDPTGYGNVPSRGQSAQDGYGTEPVTFESRREGRSESFGFEMPAAGGLGAPTEEKARNDEPDTQGEYSSLDLQQTRAQNEPHGEFTLGGNTREISTGQSESRPYQFTEVQSSYTERNPNASYGSIPDEYTFTGTFTIPRTDFRSSQRESDDRQMDGDSGDSERYLQSQSMMRDSFNDDHSIARPTNVSESSGKQERKLQESSRITQKSAITDTEAPVHVVSSSRDGILVDDVRSSLLDSEYESTASLQSNPVTAPSPYGTHEFIREDIASDVARNVAQNHTLSTEPSGVIQTSQRQAQPMTNPYQELAVPTFPRYQTKQDTESVAQMQSSPIEARGGSFRQTTSDLNDGPWPPWWSREEQKYLQPSRHVTRENGKLATDSGVGTSQGVGKNESNGSLMTGSWDPRTQQTTLLPSELTNTTNGLQRTFVPDSKWRRQYSSTSDEDESQADADPYLEELRRRRQPYVRSVASRLSVGPGSFLITGSNKSAFDNEINRIEAADISPDGLGPTREINHWISRDAVAV